MKFKDLEIIEPILKAIEEKGYIIPSPIQSGSITHILNKKDLLGCAQTGTGKTAAFAIPILQNLYINNTNANSEKKKIRVLVLTPTRELAIQIRDNFREYGKYTNLKSSVIFGGVNQNSQIEVLKKGLDILIATPGRLLDLINQKHAKLDNVECLVLDEADSMLDMGFIHDVKRVVACIPTVRQTLLFSATMPKEMRDLANTFLKNQEEVIVNPVASTVDLIKQSVYFVDKGNKTPLLIDILKSISNSSVLVFVKTKHGANRLVETLEKSNIHCAAIHGNKSQSARQYVLENFKTGKINVLIATDIAARGIDIKELSYVINYELPNIPETYVHRIGRTARAGLSGVAISLCNIDEKEYLISIEKLVKKHIEVIYDHAYPMTIYEKTPTEKKSNFHQSKKTTMKTTKDSNSNNKFTTRNKSWGNKSNDKNRGFSNSRVKSFRKTPSR